MWLQNLRIIHQAAYVWSLDNTMLGEKVGTNYDTSIRGEGYHLLFNLYRSPLFTWSLQDIPSSPRLIVMPGPSNTLAIVHTNT